MGKLPQLARDYTDRNRTSPFAFTGNKFEFRAVGSSQNVAAPMAVLVAAMADALEGMAEKLKAKLEKNGGRDAALLELLREVFTETTPVRFEGNNYSEEWKLEAGRRGLPNHSDTPAALTMLRDARRTAFLRETGVFSERELESRYNIALERYVKHVTLEAETLLEMLRTYVVPAGERQLVTSAEAAAAAESVPAAAQALGARVKEIGKAVGDVLAGAANLEALLAASETTHDEAACARKLADEVRPAMAEARRSADRLERLVEDELWSLPKYREMLFIK